MFIFKKNGQKMKNNEISNMLGKFYDFSPKNKNTFTNVPPKQTNILRRFLPKKKRNRKKSFISFNYFQRLTLKDIRKNMTKS